MRRCARNVAKPRLRPRRRRGVRCSDAYSIAKPKLKISSSDARRSATATQDSAGVEMQKSSAGRRGSGAARRASRRLRLRRAAALRADVTRRFSAAMLRLRRWLRSSRFQQPATNGNNSRMPINPSTPPARRRRLAETSRTSPDPDSARESPRDIGKKRLASPSVRNRAPLGGRKAGWCASRAAAAAIRTRAAARNHPARCACRPRHRTSLAPLRFKMPQICAGAEHQQIRGHALRRNHRRGRNRNGRRQRIAIRHAMAIAAAHRMSHQNGGFGIESRRCASAIRPRPSRNPARCAKENASWLSPCPGRSNAYVLNPWPAKSSAEVHHQPAVGGKPVQQNHAAGRLHVRRRIKDRHRRMATARVEPHSCFGQVPPRESSASRAPEIPTPSTMPRMNLPELHRALRDACSAP